MNWFRSVLIVVMLLAASSHTLAQQTFRYNFEYTCNKERVIVGHCRRDSDEPGYPPTRDEDNYCSVIYPDRPHRGGFEVQTVELRSDIINKLATCGVFQERRPSLPQASSDTPAKGEIIGPEVAAANLLILKGNELLASNPTEANKYFEAAIVKFDLPQVF